MNLILFKLLLVVLMFASIQGQYWPDQRAIHVYRPNNPGTLTFPPVTPRVTGTFPPLQPQPQYLQPQPQYLQPQPLQYSQPQPLQYPQPQPQPILYPQPQPLFPQPQPQNPQPQFPQPQITQTPRPSQTAEPPQRPQTTQLHPFFPNDPGTLFSCSQIKINSCAANQPKVCSESSGKATLYNNLCELCGQQPNAFSYRTMRPGSKCQ